MGKKTILLIEDEPHLAQGLKLNLGLAGYDVLIAPSALSALSLWQGEGVDLIILDLMLPDLPGEKLLKKIRGIDERLPILILSAKGSAEDKVSCLQAGADDYLSKPFHLEELLVRVGGLLKKRTWYAQAQTEVYTFGENSIDLISGKAQGPRGEVQLTQQELKLLGVFVHDPDRPLSRKEILQRAWGYSETITTRTLDNFIVRFRKYFESDPKRPLHFKSVRSLGYIFSST